MPCTNKEMNKIIKIDFWITEFLILLISNYYRWMTEWNTIGLVVSIVIFFIWLQYCVIHIKQLVGYSVKLSVIVLVELCFVASIICTILVNRYLLCESHEINFPFILVLTVLISPMVLINSKVLRND